MRGMFQSAAERQVTYTFNYEWEVAEFYRKNPAELERIRFISVGRVWAKPVGGTKAIDANQDTYMRGTVQRTRDVFGACAQRGMNPGELFIYMAEPLKRPGLPLLLGAHVHQGILCAYVFDHEAGHALTRNGIGQFNLSECAADAYAVLRHLQRFGMQSTYLESVAAIRAVELIFRQEWSGVYGNHFSSPVIDAVLRDSRAVDFSALSQAETIALADRYALAHAHHPELVRQTAANFSAFRGKLSDMALGDYSALELLGQHVLTTRAFVDFKYGARALLAFLDGRVTCDETVLQPEGSQWQLLRQAIKQRQADCNDKKAVFFGFQRDAANNNGGPR